MFSQLAIVTALLVLIYATTAHPLLRAQSLGYNRWWCRHRRTIQRRHELRWTEVGR